ncbi:retrovirus-related Pol polyprotein from type-2 retrotransposable element R2DM [Elysia marginata]|uniref:Retrovirus-related Pol polyprotein from type-2 retrotransposable element R2DM n=1 Tax=Elysia marginata TaxID=1093978 RepID=A0AAV4EGP5_9GAST|nr:retrovirus-related Pol polyprotein from type-2 retrotransposable element R2DM [Elysia marginata]
MTLTSQIDLGFIRDIAENQHKWRTFMAEIRRGAAEAVQSDDPTSERLYETILRNVESNPGLKIGGRMINNLRYADDTVLVAENEEDLQNLLDIAVRESKKMGLELNSKKTEVMVINLKEIPGCDIYI